MQQTVVSRLGTSSFASFAALFATLITFWVMLNGTLAGDVLAVGLVVALVIALAFRNGFAIISELRLTPLAIWATLGYIPFYLKELFKSNLSLAAVVLSPSLPLNPGIVKVRTTLQSRMGRMLLANSITLTPGTLTVELEGEWLYVHWVNVDSTDCAAATTSIVAGFERYLEVMYG